jgi:hypothetical protein
VASVPAATVMPDARSFVTGGAQAAVSRPYRDVKAPPWKYRRFWTEMFPPGALTRSMLRSLIVSPWSKNRGRCSGHPSSAAIFSNVEVGADRLVVGGVQPEAPPGAEE